MQQFYKHVVSSFHAPSLLLSQRRFQQKGNQTCNFVPEKNERRFLSLERADLQSYIFMRHCRRQQQHFYWRLSSVNFCQQNSTFLQKAFYSERQGQEERRVEGCKASRVSPLWSEVKAACCQCDSFTTRLIPECQNKTSFQHFSAVKKSVSTTAGSSWLAELSSKH